MTCIVVRAILIANIFVGRDNCFGTFDFQSPGMFRLRPPVFSVSASTNLAHGSITNVDTKSAFFALQSTNFSRFAGAFDISSIAEHLQRHALNLVVNGITGLQ